MELTILMSFSSNGTSSLCSEVDGEVMGSCPPGACNLPIKKKKRSCLMITTKDLGTTIELFRLRKQLL
jgi:hypothetical protein